MRRRISSGLGLCRALRELSGWIANPLLQRTNRRPVMQRNRAESRQYAKGAPTTTLSEININVLARSGRFLVL